VKESQVLKFFTCPHALLLLSQWVAEKLLVQDLLEQIREPFRVQSTRKACNVDEVLTVHSPYGAVIVGSCCLRLPQLVTG